MTPSAHQMLTALSALRDEQGTCADPKRGEEIREEIVRIERTLVRMNVSLEMDA